jgi:arylsulfatase A-like enzyme
MVIFTSDHGEMLGAHGMREKNVFYEESAHIPLIIKFPGQIKKGTRVNGYVSTIDLFATINDYMKMPESPSNGTSLRGLMEGKESSQGKYVVTEWLYHQDRSPAYMIVKDNWKMFIPYSAESKVINALYNLREDPHELNNLLGNNPNRKKYEAKATELRNDMLEWLLKRNSAHYEGVKARDLIN